VTGWHGLIVERGTEKDKEWMEISQGPPFSEIPLVSENWFATAQAGDDGPTPSLKKYHERN
jgi:hypothetical protein